MFLDGHVCECVKVLSMLHNFIPVYGSIMASRSLFAFVNVIQGRHIGRMPGQ